MYDIADRASFERVGHWVEELGRQAPGTVLVIAGNKCDLGDAARQAPWGQGRLGRPAVFFRAIRPTYISHDALRRHDTSSLAETCMPHFRTLQGDFGACSGDVNHIERAFADLSSLLTQ